MSDIAIDHHEPTAELPPHRARRFEQKDIALPAPGVSYTQDREWCVVRLPDGWRQFRFHDYAKIYKIPGLYEALFYDVLECASPPMVRRMLEESLERSGDDISDLRVLDLGAGNGMVGEELAEAGAEHIVGVDIIEEAAAAAKRDRGGVYDEYVVADMTDLPEDARNTLRDHDLNCLICVAALGFGDIPPAAFRTAYNLIDKDGWVAFNIKSELVENREKSGFAGLVNRMLEDGIVELDSRKRYRHRIATTGDPLYYDVFIARKRRDLPASF